MHRQFGGSTRSRPERDPRRWRRANPRDGADGAVARRDERDRRATSSSGMGECGRGSRTSRMRGSTAWSTRPRRTTVRSARARCAARLVGRAPRSRSLTSMQQAELARDRRRSTRRRSRQGSPGPKRSRSTATAPTGGARRQRSTSKVAPRAPQGSGPRSPSGSRAVRRQSRDGAPAGSERRPRRASARNKQAPQNPGRAGRRVMAEGSPCATAAGGLSLRVTVPISGSSPTRSTTRSTRGVAAMPIDEPTRGGS